MGIMANIKGNKAYKLHSAKDYQGALKLYEEAFAEGMDMPRNILAYISLLIRLGEYQKARDISVKVQKWPGFAGEQKSQLFCNYAAAVCRLGEVDKGVAVLERQAAKQPNGLVYQTLGYLYVVQLEHQPSPDEPAPVKEPEPVDPEDEDAEDEDEPVEEEPVLTPYELWQQNVEKAKAFLEQSVDYDDEDSVCLDNLAQFYYRVLKDKVTAKEYFEKAAAIKETQIDTQWFLSRYDVEAGDNAAAIKRLKIILSGSFSALNFVTKADVEAEIRRLGGNPED